MLQFSGFEPGHLLKISSGSARLGRKKCLTNTRRLAQEMGESQAISPTILSKFLNLPHHWPNHYPLHLLHLCPVSVSFATSLDVSLTTPLATHITGHKSVHSTGYIPGHISVMFTNEYIPGHISVNITCHKSYIITDRSSLATSLAESP